MKKSSVAIVLLVLLLGISIGMWAGCIMAWTTRPVIKVNELQVNSLVIVPPESYPDRRCARLAAQSTGSVPIDCKPTRFDVAYSEAPVVGIVGSVMYEESTAIKREIRPEVVSVEVRMANDSVQQLILPARSVRRVGFVQ